MGLKRRIFLCLLVIALMVMPVSAETIRWVDFGVPYESLKYALDQDIATSQQEKHISWIDTLALAACRTGGKCGLSSVKKAVKDTLAIMRKGGGYILAPTHAIPHDVPEKNVIAMLEEFNNQ